MKNNKTGIDKTGLTNTLKKAFNTSNTSNKLPAFALLLLFLLAPLSSAKATVQIVNQDIQGLFAKQLKATFKQTAFTNLEPAPINFWYQAEVNNQVVYFSPTQALIFLGEVYNNNGTSLSAQALKKWQSRRVANLDVSAALVIGTGVIEIIEFTDTDCPFCQRFNQWITATNNIYKNKHNQDLFTRKIVLTPIDQLHPNAHKEAVHILCQSPENYETALKQTLEAKISFAEMDSCQKGKALLKKHRKIAKQLGVSATPTLVINGQIIQGFNQQKLEIIIKQQLNQTTEVRQTKARQINGH